MGAPSLVFDSRLMWLEVPKKGSPSEWIPGNPYQIGDTVIPRAGVPIPPGKENVMFQCIGYCGKTDPSQPVFPTVEGNTVEETQILWATRDPEKDPYQIANDEYYVIDRVVTIS